MDVVAIFGPTAVGKTAFAIALADHLPSPTAISADALQVYRGLETLTGVASPEEQARLEHRLVAFLPVDATWSVAQHAQQAHREIDAALVRGGTPIVVGGTGLYLRAALTDLDLRPPPPAEVRERWIRALHDRGPQALHEELRRRAPWAAEPVAPTDAHRLVRLLELHDMGALVPQPRESQLWTTHTRHPTRLLGLTMERDELAPRIDARVDAMVAAGAAQEVERADAAGASETARKALGFRELLAGDVDAMKRRTRQYARRQLTWMRKLPGVELIDLTDRDPAEAARALASGA